MRTATSSRGGRSPWPDRKSTRLNSSHLGISYAVFCLKKKKKINRQCESRTRNTVQHPGDYRAFCPEGPVTVSTLGSQRCVARPNLLGNPARINTRMHA